MTGFNFKNKGKVFISLAAFVLLSSLFLVRCGQAPQDKTQSSLIDKQSTITTTDHNHRLFFKSFHEDIKFGYAVQSCFVKLGGNFLVDGYNSFCGEYNPNQNISTGSVAYVNDIKINGRNVRITGQVVQVQKCDVDVSQTIDKAKQNNNNSVIPPQFIRDGKLKLENNDKLTLPSGIYYFKEIKISGRAVLEFSGPATVVVEGDVSVEGQGQIKTNPVFLRIISTGKVKVEGQGSIYAGIVGNEVKVDGKGQIFGGVISREFKGEGQGAVHFDKGLGLDRIEVYPSEVTIKVGETVQLTAVAKDTFGNEISCVGFEWSSSNPTIATVDENGIVQGVNVGRVIVSATAKKEGYNLAFKGEAIINIISLPGQKFPPVVTLLAEPTEGYAYSMVVKFKITAYDPDGGLISYGKFDINGDGIYEFEGEMGVEVFDFLLPWRYTTPGTFYPTVVFMDDEEQATEASVKITIHPFLLKGYVYATNFFSDSVSIINLEDFSGRKVAVGDGPVDIIFSWDKTKAFISHAYSNSISVIDTATFEVIDVITTPSAFLLGITITSDDRKLYVASYFGGLFSIDIITREIKTIPIPLPQAPIIVGRNVYVTADESIFPVGQGSVYVIDTLTDEIIAKIPVGVDVNVIQFFGGYIFASHTYSNIFVIDPNINQVIGTLPISGIAALLITPEYGGRIYATRADALTAQCGWVGSGGLVVYNFSPVDFSSYPIAGLNIGKKLLGMDFIPDSKILLVASQCTDEIFAMGTEELQILYETFGRPVVEGWFPLFSIKFEAGDGPMGVKLFQR
jgi:DNA-binding beta-propeller fold protein YncE